MLEGLKTLEEVSMRFLILLGFLVGAFGHASEATYFRAWQGFTKPGVARPDFLSALGPFMQSTIDVYKGGALNNYLVAVTPDNAPAYLPTEFALIALTSEEIYKQVRSTPEGQAYAESHWQIFDKAISKSAAFGTIADAEERGVQHNQAYDMIGKPIDWSAGYNAFWLGTRKAELSETDFLRDLWTHVQGVATDLGPQGLTGYIIITNKDYEVAYMHWDSKEQAEAAFATEIGKKHADEAATLMDPIVWKEAQEYKGVAEAGGFYSTVR